MNFERRPGDRTALDNLTLLVMSRNRPRMLAQAVNHYKCHMQGAQVLVSDGTGLDVSYWQRLCSALETISTPFVVIASDDDVFLSDGIARAIDTLHAHPKAGAAHGTYYSARLEADGAPLFEIESQPESNDFDDPIARLATVFAAYQQSTYAVHRTEALRFAAHMPATLTSEHFSELLLTTRGALYAPVLAFDAPYMIRNQQFARETTDWAFTFTGHPTIAWLSNREEFIDQYLLYQRDVCNLLDVHALEGISRQHLVDTLFGIYWSKTFGAPLIFGALRRRGVFAIEDQREIHRRYAPTDAASSIIPEAQLFAATAGLRDSGWPRYIDRG